MGSKSDWPIMKHASDTLTKLSIKHEKKSFLLIEHQIYYSATQRVPQIVASRFLSQEQEGQHIFLG